jgi:hypothetical protein
MPAATVTPEAIQWDKGYLIAPDAFYHRALVNIDRTNNTVTVRDRQGGLQATYTLNGDYTFDADTNELRGTLTAGPADSGDILIRPDGGCSCLGYKKTAR